MSLIEEVRNVEERVLARLHELEPLVAEHRELSKLAERLGLDSKAAAAPAKRQDAPPARKQPARTKKARSSRSAARAQPRRSATTRDRQVLAAVQATPGVTVAEVARQLGVDPTSLYRPVRKLTKEGTLVKRGLQLHPGK